MSTNYNITVDYIDGCRSWYYFDDERKANRKAKQLAKFDRTKRVTMTVIFK